MDTRFNNVLNPAAPGARNCPRDLPELTATQETDALAAAFAERARTFAIASGLLFILLARSVYATSFQGPHQFALAIGGVILVRVVSWKQTNALLLKWGNAACILFGVCLAYALHPRITSEARLALEYQLLVSMLAGCFFLEARWWMIHAVATGSCFFLAAGHFLSPGDYVLIAVVAVVSLLVHRVQSSAARRSASLRLTDEARLAVYTEAVEERRKAQHRFEKFSEAGKEAMIFHAGGKVVDANNAAQELLELGRTNLVGRPVADLLAPGSGRLLAQISDRKNTYWMRVKVVRGDSTQVDALAYNNELVFPDGSVAVLGLRTVERNANPEAAVAGLATAGILNN